MVKAPPGCELPYGKGGDPGEIVPGEPNDQPRRSSARPPGSTEHETNAQGADQARPAPLASMTTRRARTKKGPRDTAADTTSVTGAEASNRAPPSPTRRWSSHQAVLGFTAPPTKHMWGIRRWARTKKGPRAATPSHDE